MKTLFIIHLLITVLFIFLYFRTKNKAKIKINKLLKDLKDIEHNNNQHFEEFI